MNKSHGNLLTIECKNPSCKNTFQLYRSEISKKLYCSRKCRSEHHWSINPLFEKKCKNSMCSKIIKRKFKQQINKVHYCSPQCRKIHRNRIFQKKLDDTIKSNCCECGVEIITKREPCGKLIPRKFCDSCAKEKKNQYVMRATEKYKFLYHNDVNFRESRRKKYKHTGIMLKKKYRAEGLPCKWIQWYQNFCLFGKSKLEDRVFDYIKSKNIFAKRWYSISNLFVDIYIPDKKLIIECFGDYWHMNPLKYSKNDYNKSTKRSAQEQWNKDRKRKIFMESEGYKVVELWENEINGGDYSKLDIYI